MSGNGSTIKTIDMIPGLGKENLFFFGECRLFFEHEHVYLCITHSISFCVYFCLIFDLFVRDNMRNLVSGSTILGFSKMRGIWGPTASGGLCFEKTAPTYFLSANTKSVGFLVLYAKWSGLSEGLLWGGCINHYRNLGKFQNVNEFLFAVYYFYQKDVRLNFHW